MKNDKVIDVSNMFSLTFEDSSDSNELENIKKQRDTLFEMINSFLEKLKDDPKKDTIKWPNRIADVEKFQEKLKGIMEE